jgi:APA family basic amino acid/polyamine antiporter
MTKLRKDLTFFGLTMVAIGSCVGSGIFITPHEIASHLPSGGHMLLVWALGGVISLTGALTFSELAGLFPKTGGVYQYLKEAYGEVFAFLYGWCILLVVTSGAIAALSIAFAEYLNFFLDFGPGGKMVVALFTIVTITLANIFGVRISQLFSNFFTVTKLVGIALIIGIAFILGTISFEQATQITEVKDLESSFSLALIGVLWSYGGWHHASYLAGETRNANKVIPKAMMLGTLVVTVVYLLCNLAYLFILSVDEIAAEKAVAAEAIGRVLSWGGPLMAILIAISVFGTASIYTLTAPRIYYRMASDGVFFSLFGKIHTKYKVPVWAIVLQSGWAVVLLIFWGTFSNLIGYVVFTDWLFMLLAGVSIFIFRYRKKKDERPVKAWGYPVTPIIFCGIVTWFIYKILALEPLQAWAGLLLLAVGFPVYYAFKYFAKKEKEGKEF